MNAAEKRGIPCRRDGDGSRVQLGYGKNLRYVQAAMTDQTSAIAVELAQEKDDTKERLRRNGIPVPNGTIVRSLEEANQAADSLTKPVAVKPSTGHQGHGVSLEVSTPGEMRVAFEGQDGIKSIDDVVFIKSLVAERVGEGGTLILNADNEHLVKLAKSERVSKVPKTIVYFSLDEKNPVVREHLRAAVPSTSRINAR